MKEDKFNGIPLIRIILLFVSIVGIWFFWKEWVRRKKIKDNLINLLTDISAALSTYQRYINFDVYFSQHDEQEYYQKYHALFLDISIEYPNLGLDVNAISKINKFVYLMENLPNERKNYNDLFVEEEAKKYAVFLKALKNTHYLMIKLKQFYEMKIIIWW